VADDTDVLVLLVHHFRPHMADVFMLSEKSVRSKACSVVMPVHRICARIGPVVASALPLIHAISGCDTTSAMYGHGKASVFRKIAGSSSALDLSEIVSDVGRHQESVSAAGLKLISMIYGGKPDESLNHLRYVAYMNQLATSSLRSRPERLPPSERAAHFHAC